MDEANIRRYAQLMKELDLTGLEITEGDTVVRLERNGAAPVLVAPAAPAPLSAPAEVSANAARGTPVCSPMVGVFYVAPSENAAPFVSVGDQVKQGDVLCIIEAMKLMNEITAERDGVIAEVCATDGQAVEYGTVLFRMED